jgi:hypothetical protein
VGIELRGGDTVAADTVIAAGGRSLPIERWLTAIGADTPASEAEACGSNCYTRYFRLRDSGEHSATRQLRFHHEPGYGVAELIGADNGTFACELAMPTADRDFHQLRDVSAWTAAAGSVAPWREWLDPERSKPITPGIDIMGQERNTLRHFVRNGQPLALSVHAIGDARCQTDSLFAWGCGNALLSAIALADAIAAHPDDPHDQALALEAAIQHELSGRYTHSRDRNRAFALAANGQQPDQTPTRVIDDVMYPAIKHDPEVYRAVMRWELQLDGADALSDNQPIIQLAHSVQQESPHDADDFPTRDELVAAVRSAS